MGGDHSLKFGVGLAPEPDHDVHHFSGGGARHAAVLRTTMIDRCGDGTPIAAGGNGNGMVPRVGVGRPRRPVDEQRLVDLQRVHPGVVQPRQAALERRRPLRLAAVEVVGGCVPSNILGHPSPEHRDGAAAGAVPGRAHRGPERPRPAAVQPVRAARVGDLRPDRQRQDADPRELLALLLDEDHAGQRPWQPRRRHAVLGQHEQQRHLRGNARTSCWQDLNLDGFVQTNELSWVQGGIQPGARLRAAGRSFNRRHRRAALGLNTVDDERPDRPHARSHRRHAARADPEPGRRRRLHLPQLRPRDHDLPRRPCSRAVRRPRPCRASRRATRCRRSTRSGTSTRIR